MTDISSALGYVDLHGVFGEGAERQDSKQQHRYATRCANLSTYIASANLPRFEPEFLRI